MQADMRGEGPHNTETKKFHLRVHSQLLRNASLIPIRQSGMQNQLVVLVLVTKALQKFMRRCHQFQNTFIVPIVRYRQQLQYHLVHSHISQQLLPSRVYYIGVCTADAITLLL